MFIWPFGALTVDYAPPSWMVVIFHTRAGVILSVLGGTHKKTPTSYDIWVCMCNSLSHLSGPKSEIDEERQKNLLQSPKSASFCQIDCSPLERLLSLALVTIFKLPRHMFLSHTHHILLDALLHDASPLTPWRGRILWEWFFFFG